MKKELFFVCSASVLRLFLESKRKLQTLQKLVEARDVRHRARGITCRISQSGMLYLRALNHATSQMPLKAVFFEQNSS